jgi:anti-sigma regulatory factor (Ser/Thr protein kinase)
MRGTGLASLVHGHGPRQLTDPVTQMSRGQSVGGAFSHQAVYYRAPGAYLDAVLPFVRDGLARGEPVLVAVPEPMAALVRSGLNGQHAQVSFAPMTELGRNPGRIISAVWEFIGQQHGRPVRFLGEPFWPARTAAEVREAVRHEALLNLAFGAAPVAILCPYDAGQLARHVITSACRTHPVIRGPAGLRPSLAYIGGRVPRAAARPLPRPPRRAARLVYAGDLRPVRDFVARQAEEAGLGPDRSADLVLAAGELAANSLRHASGTGELRVWFTRDEIVCQVTDCGQIADPLVGRRRPPDASGLGLWVVHQVCDLVELRTGRHGTVVRMHVRRP